MANLKQNVQKRLISLDAFRGFAIALMIFVNNTEDNTYAQLQHAKWNGWTIADIIFPLFLWIIGLTVVFSLSRETKSGSKKDVLFHILKRVVILFMLGIFLNAFPFFHLTEVRIPGVLQRIAICYFIASILYLFTGIKGVGLGTLIILTVYWILIKLFGEVLPQRIDTYLLHGHLWSNNFDPEGIVSTFAATSTVFFGIMTGHFLKKIRSEDKKVSLLIIMGIILILLGQVMNLFLPINKNLWTSSYAVFMAGIASLVFSVFYYLIERKGKYQIFQTFTIYGMNPLFLYILSSLFTAIFWIIPIKDTPLFKYMSHNLLWRMLGEKNTVALFAFANVILFYVVARFLYRRKWFLKI